MIRLSCLLLLLLPVSVMAGEDAYEQAPILYSKTQAHDSAQALDHLLSEGRVKLDRSNAWTVLRGIMKHLGIPVESQVLVFSKTSKQNDRISPETPRAIYFNDDAYIGYSVGGSIEVAAIDPLLGPVFYLLDPHAAEKRPLRFERDQSCLSCHGGTFTPEIPGVLVRSVFPAATGHPILSQGTTVVDTTTPFSDRWGGWYVTGKHGSGLHRGNVIAVEQPDDTCEMPVEQGANITDLAGLFDVSEYPRKQSDIVALMVLEHQTSTQNALTKANHAALRAMHMQRNLQKELGERINEAPVGTARRIIDHSAEDVLDALLFKEEAALPDGGIEGDVAFQTAFAGKAPRSSEGRSLKDFQLLTRLFKYRCSYMIHSVTFKNLTPPLKETVLAGLKRAIEGTYADGRYDHLSASERANIQQILEDTGILPQAAGSGNSRPISSTR